MQGISFAAGAFLCAKIGKEVRYARGEQRVFYGNKKEYPQIPMDGVVTISVSFSVSPKWLAKFSSYAKKDKIAVSYFNTETLELAETEMYITGYKAKLEKDTSYKGLWSVSFTLNEF